MTTSFMKRELKLSKFDDVHRIAYGWAIVSCENGEDYYDLQGDHIPMDAIIPASIEFMKSSRASDDMHLESQTGEVVYCAPVMAGQLVDPAYPTREGLWIGTQIHDDEVYQMAKRGERRGFSIGGFLVEADYIGPATKRHIRGSSLRQLDAEFLKERSTSKANKPQRIFRAFDLAFISTVDWPAQEGAMISIVKGAPKERLIWVAKGVVFTDEVDGHQHVINTNSFDEDGQGSTGSAQLKGSDWRWHSHDMIVDGRGKIEIGANAGHTHTVEARGKKRIPATQGQTVSVSTVAMRAPKDPKVTEEETEEETEEGEGKKPKKKPAEQSAYKGAVQNGQPAVASTPNQETTNVNTEELQKQLDQALKDVAKFRALAELSDSQRLYYGKLGPDGQQAFLGKSAGDRAAELEKQVEYTTPITGDIYYKFDDSRAVRNAKRADESEKAAAEDRLYAKRAGFAKKAGEVFGKAYPGEDKTHTAIVEAIEGISDEPTRKAAYEVFTAGRNALLAKQRTNGHSGPVSKAAGEGGMGASGANDENTIEKRRGDVRKAVEAYQTLHKIATYEEALAEAVEKDPATRAAYDAMYAEE
jgi:hypothetical protein